MWIEVGYAPDLVFEVGDVDVGEEEGEGGCW